MVANSILIIIDVQLVLGLMFTCHRKPFTPFQAVI
jgi:hypothetical protein